MNAFDMTEIIERNNPTLKKLVSQFMRKVSASYRGGMIDREDLLQEVRLCFVQEVRRYGEETALRHVLSFKHAMYDAARKALPVSISYHGYDKRWRQPLRVEELNPERQQAGRNDAAFARAAFYEAFDGLEEKEREVIRLRLEGLTRREIALTLGVSAATVTRIMQRIRQKLEPVN